MSIGVASVRLEITTGNDRRTFGDLKVMFVFFGSFFRLPVVLAMLSSHREVVGWIGFVRRSLFVGLLDFWAFQGRAFVFVSVNC